MRFLKLAVLSASMILILAGCGGSSSPQPGQTGGSAAAKRANPSDEIKSAIEEVVGATKIITIMQNSPTKGWINLILSSSRKLTMDDFDELKSAVEDKGYVFEDGGKIEDEPDDNLQGLTFSGDPYYVMVIFEPGKQEIAATLAPAAEAKGLIEEP